MKLTGAKALIKVEKVMKKKNPIIAVRPSSLSKFPLRGSYRPAVNKGTKIEHVILNMRRRGFLNEFLKSVLIRTFNDVPKETPICLF